VFENRVLRKELGRKRDDILGGWRKLHNEEFHNFINIRMINSRRMTGTGDVERTTEVHTKLW
jgi:hypothetical protein